MELFQRLNPDFQFADDRGELTQLVHEGYEQVNVLFTKAGVVRGGHYHKISEEVFFVVSGRVTVQLKKDDKSCTETFEKGDFFKIFPWVRHTMNFDKDTVLVAMYDKQIENKVGEKDIYT